MKKKTSKKTTAKRAKTKTTKKLDNLSQAHGKDESPENSQDKFQPTTLEQVWGDDGSWKYNTHNEDEYLNQVKGMTKTDVMAHATKIGLIPVDNRELLQQRLVREFRRHNASYEKPTDKMNTNTDISVEARKILSEGR